MNRYTTQVWYPYTQMADTFRNHLVSDARGVELNIDGKWVIDGISSWWSVLHGYKDPTLDEAVKHQLSKFSHVMLGGLTHTPAEELATKIVSLAKGNLQHVFFSDSGSVGVEVALKMCIQYWMNKGESKKRKMVCFRKAYHGDTTGAMAVGDPEESMHAIFSGILMNHLLYDAPPADESCSILAGVQTEPPRKEAVKNHTPFSTSKAAHGIKQGSLKFSSTTHHTSTPNEQDYLNNLDQFLSQHAHEIAGLIIEPLIQCAGGFNMYSSQILVGLRELCHKHDVLLVFDEVATGICRTGSLFAFQHPPGPQPANAQPLGPQPASPQPRNSHQAEPDILVLGKGLTGGYMGLAATVAASHVFEAFYEKNNAKKAFMHGPTFMGNPLACSVALKSLELAEKRNYSLRFNKMEALCRHHINALLKENPDLFSSKISKVKDIRVKAGVFVVELHSREQLKGFCDYALSKGVWLRGFETYIYTMPAGIITDDQLLKVLDVIVGWVYES